MAAAFCRFFSGYLWVKNMGGKVYSAAIIGTGRIGFSLGLDRKREQPASHTMALLLNRRIKIIAGIDENEENLFAWKKYVSNHVAHLRGNKNPVACYLSVSDFFSDCKSCKIELPDIIVIAVNEKSHFDVALKAIQAKPRLVILEKPVALNVRQGKIIESCAQFYGVPVIVNHERRFACDYEIARQYMNKIGDIQSICARLDSGLRVYSRNAEDDGAFSLLHDGTHLMDVILFLLEEKAKKSSLDIHAQADEQAFEDSQTSFDLQAIEAAQIPVDSSFCMDVSMPEKSFGSESRLLKDMKILSFHLDEKDRNIVRNLRVGYKSPFCEDITFSISGRSRFFGFEVHVIGTEGAFCIGNGIFSFEKRMESKLYSGFYSLSKDRSVRKPYKTCYFSNMVQNAVDFLDGKKQLKSTVKTGMDVLCYLEEIVNEIKTNVL